MREKAPPTFKGKALGTRLDDFMFHSCHQFVSTIILRLRKVEFVKKIM